MTPCRRTAMIPALLILLALSGPAFSPAPAGPTESLSFPGTVQSSPGPPVADVYAYDDCGGFVLGVDTRPIGRAAHEALQGAGYASTFFETASAEEALDRLTRSDVFYFAGHGANTAIAFWDGDCNRGLITSQQVEQAVQAAPDHRWRLVALLGCETASNPFPQCDGCTAMMDAFWNDDEAADMVIGFAHEIHLWALKYWNKRFLKYAIDEGWEVRDSATQAARDTANHWLYWLFMNEWSAIAHGMRDVYLVPVAEPAPPPAPGDEGNLWEQIRRWFEGLDDGLRDWWEATKADWAQRLKDWLSEQLVELARLIGIAIARKLGELCGGVTMTGLLVLAAVGTSRRPRRRRGCGCLVVLGVMVLLFAAAIWLVNQAPQQGRAADLAPAVAELAGDPDLELTQEEQRDVAFGQLTVYGAELKNGDPVSFEVDADGQVRGFYRYRQPGQTVKVDLASARETALAFARANYGSPSLLDQAPTRAELIDRGRGTDKWYSFEWVRADPDSGALLPQGVRIEVNAQTGNVDGYSSWNEPVTVPTMPAISREAAERSALHTLTGLTGARVTETSLMVSTVPVFEPGGDQALLWAVVIKGDPDESGYTPGAFVFIDALTGHVVAAEPFA